MNAREASYAVYGGKLDDSDLKTLRRSKALVYNVCYASVLTLLTVAGLVLLLAFGRLYLSLILFAVVLGGLFRVIYFNVKLVTVWKESSESFKRERKITFYKNRLVSVSSGGEAEIGYGEIHKIKRVGKLMLFYILPKKDGRYIVIDASKLTGSSPEELELLINGFNKSNA